MEFQKNTQSITNYNDLNHIIKSSFLGGWLSGKMIREAGSAPEGSRVANFSKEGKVPNQANPNWKGLASDDQTWDILDSCKRIAEKHGKTVAQV